NAQPIRLTITTTLAEDGAERAGRGRIYGLHNDHRAGNVQQISPRGSSWLIYGWLARGSAWWLSSRKNRARNGDEKQRIGITTRWAKKCLSVGLGPNTGHYRSKRGFDDAHYPKLP